MKFFTPELTSRRYFYLLTLVVAITVAIAPVFACPVLSWSQQAKVIANDGAANDGLGLSVALDGDTLVVGAPNATVGNNAGQGAAYVFVRSAGIWIQQQKLTAGDGAATDTFGLSVAISGNTIVVGALFANVGNNDRQ